MLCSFDEQYPSAARVEIAPSKQQCYAAIFLLSWGSISGIWHRKLDILALRQGTLPCRPVGTSNLSCDQCQNPVPAQSEVCSPAADSYQEFILNNLCKLAWTMGLGPGEDHLLFVTYSNM